MARPRKSIHYVSLSNAVHGCAPTLLFIYSQDTAAWRYRLHKGGHPQLVLIHYYLPSVNPIEIVPPLFNNSVRHYPLRQNTDPPIYVMGAPRKGGSKSLPTPCRSASRRYAPS
ncbi:hypothetical protein DFJ58DRAFT_796436, partial [Suillus subalutaceus]|uniref:uncharacterized protein n=1 Tax=Suillus subalutaceus TaxID=48586 RepID=UPI001B85F6E8